MVQSLTITPGTSPGALAGARQSIRALFTGSVNFTDVTSCPCSVGLFFQTGVDAFQDYVAGGTVSATGVYVPITTGGVRTFTGSSPVTVDLIARIFAGGSATTEYTVFGNMTLETIPFGSTGGTGPLSAPANQPTGDNSLRTVPSD